MEIDVSGEGEYDIAFVAKTLGNVNLPDGGAIMRIRCKLLFFEDNKPIDKDSATETFLKDTYEDYLVYRALMGSFPAIQNFQNVPPELEPYVPRVSKAEVDRELNEVYIEITLPAPDEEMQKVLSSLNN